MLKKILSAVLSVVLLLSNLVVVTSAAETEVAGTLKSYGLSSVERVIENNISVYYDENGNEVDITANNRSLRMWSSLPESYDLRDENRSTSVKDQGSEGLCWDFASTASIESNILTNPELSSKLGENAWETLDLSEAGNSWYLYTNIEDESSVLYNSYMQSSKKGADGGNAEDVAMGFSSGYGMYPEELLPYSDWNKGYTESLRFYSDYRLKDFSAFDNDVAFAKQMLMDNGAIYVSYECYDSNYNNVDDIQAYYDDGSPIVYNPDDMGHAVVIVGWDDNFSREYFCEEMRPENDGAWLCKNSWGESSGCTTEGYEGYFWMSYETDIRSLAQFVVQSVDNFDNIYQNQVVANSVLYGSNSAANVFTAKSDEVLEQICFSSIGYSDFTVDVYKLSDGYTSPVDGECVLSFESSVDLTGTHCIDCPQDVYLTAGDIFSVVITDENGFCINYSGDYYGTYSNLSYITDENGDWVDVCDVEDVGYVAIKAYTSNKDGAVNKDELSEVVEKAESFIYSEGVSQALIDNFATQLENAKAVLADDSATQNAVDNTTCVLNSCMEKISEYFYEINNLDDFMTFYNGSLTGEAVPADHIILNTDLDLSSIEDFKPMFTDSTFSGVFDGNNHTISGLNIDTEDDAGFFEKLTGATIQNITFSKCSVVGSGFVGLVCPDASDVAFINCNIVDSVVISHQDSAGGILGYGESLVIENCAVNDCEITGRSCAGVYMSFNVETTDCNADGTSVISSGMLCDDNNTTLIINDESEYFVLVTLKDLKCTVESFVGEIKDVVAEGATVVKNGDVYEFEAESGAELIVNIEYKETEECDFGYSADLITRELELITYYGDETNITFPDEIGGLSVTSISDEFGIYSDEPVKSLVFSGGLKKVDTKAFYSLESIESVTFEEGIEVIGEQVFSSCPMLKTVYLPDSLIEIKGAAFSSCENLESVNFGENLNSISDYAFYGCNKLKNIEFGDKLETIGDEAFSGCGATCVVLGKNIKNIGFRGLGYTSRYAIKMEAVEIPDFKVYGYPETDAQRYAEQNDFEFIDISEAKPEIEDSGFDYDIFLQGDVDLDGSVTVLDATLIQKWLVHEAELNSLQRHNAIVGDVYNDITIMSATYIQRYVALLIPDLNNGAIG